MSPCGHYRWWLRRQWHTGKPTLVFVGLNPSWADGRRDDPTLRRLLGFADRWGYGALEVVNLFARISASPALLRRAADPVGEANDRWLRRALGGSAVEVPAAIWLGWGNQGAWRGRDGQVLQLLQASAAGREPQLLCVGFTAAGQPRHPLYVAAATPPQRLVLAQTPQPGALCGQRAAPPWPALRAATPSICI